MDITFTVLTTDLPPNKDKGDIVHIEPMTGLTSVHPRFALLHVKGCPDDDFETFKQYYLQPFRVAVDGKIEGLKSSKHRIAHMAYADKTETIDWPEFEARLEVKHG